MTISPRVDRGLPYVVLALVFLSSLALRPIIPVDETRYVSVAWEMLQRGDFLVPTLNFAPYFQKPPLLFWLFDLAWSVLGANHAAVLVVIFAISSLSILLTKRLAWQMFPDTSAVARRTPWLMLGSVVFIVYATLILFDLLLTVMVLAFLRSLLAYAARGKLRHALFAGLFVGLGILAKGPVMLIHIACPILFYAAWRDPAAHIAPRSFFIGMTGLLLTALVVVAAWLAPALHAMGGDFAYNLVWRQSAGRISGDLESAHARPVYFYLFMIPGLLLPWVATIDFWKARPLGVLRDVWTPRTQEQRYLRLLVLWFVVLFVVFSLISGKQPHYLVPLLPLAVLVVGYVMRRDPVSRLRTTAVAIVVTATIGQSIAAYSVFPRYDLGPLADFVAAHRDADWASVGRYKGEVTFHAKLTEPIEIIEPTEAGAWLLSHPNGFLLSRHPLPADVPHRSVFSKPDGYSYFVASR